MYPADFIIYIKTVIKTVKFTEGFYNLHLPEGPRSTAEMVEPYSTYCELLATQYCDPETM
jgi:hypothetical protein